MIHDVFHAFAAVFPEDAFLTMTMSGMAYVLGILGVEYKNRCRKRCYEVLTPLLKLLSYLKLPLSSQSNFRHGLAAALARWYSKPR